MNATQQTPERFEERLLAELRRVVVEDATTDAQAPAARRPAPGWRRRPLALAGGLAAVAAAAGVAGLALTGGEEAAWAVTRNADGTVTVRINSLSDADGLEQRLAAAGVPALVQYLPAGKVCAGDPVPGAPVTPPGDGKGAVTEERGLSEAPAGAPESGFSQAGAPPAGDGKRPQVQASMRIDEDGGVEFTIDPPADRGQAVVITSQTLAAPSGATLDGAALSVELVNGEARPCDVVDAPK